MNTLKLLSAKRDGSFEEVNELVITQVYLNNVQIGKVVLCFGLRLREVHDIMENLIKLDQFLVAQVESQGLSRLLVLLFELCFHRCNFHIFIFV